MLWRIACQIRLDGAPSGGRFRIELGDHRPPAVRVAMPEGWGGW